ncbi:MAG: hypothetical protein IJU03_08070 [Thermoguttaceae bacterium]|nr:hypothetical protein [Thermoguttaceae bacterium]
MKTKNSFISASAAFVVFLALATFAASCGFAQESGLEILWNAAERQGTTDRITSFEATYEATITNAQKDGVKTKRRVMQAYVDDDTFCYLETPSDGGVYGAPAHMTRQRGRFPQAQYELFDLETQGSLFLSSTKMTTEDFARIGRLSGTFAEMVQNASSDLKDNISKIFQFDVSESETKINGEASYVVELKTTTGVLMARYVITPSLGGVCSSIQTFNPATGDLISEQVADNFICEKTSKLYYPLHYVITEYDPKSGELASKREFQFDESSLRINRKIKPKEFVMTVPKGATLYDGRVDPPIQKAAPRDVEISLANDSIDLETMTELVEAPKVGESVPIALDEPESSTFYRIALSVLGAIIIVGAIVVAMRRRNAS